MTTPATSATVPIQRHHAPGPTPYRWVLRLLPAGMTLMVWIDHRLGESAEYFDAWELLQAWGGVLAGDGLGGHSFLAGQDHLGDPLSLAIGSTLFVLEPAIALAMVVFGGSMIRRVATRPRTATDRRHQPLAKPETTEGHRW
ncbi:MAG: hypothetical protein GY925_00875 [Actinomycetia bacterium]|nr:hypothetical protein [Actinomycetes bacterium]